MERIPTCLEVGGVTDKWVDLFTYENVRHNKHDHISGRPRNYISRKWFYRGRHRKAKHERGRQHR